VQAKIEMWEWLPVLEPQDKPAVQRLLAWRLEKTRLIYRFLNGPTWVEVPGEGGQPAILGWEADAQEIR
jgi:hypothetical protein